jgi:hypothetical protein
VYYAKEYSEDRINDFYMNADRILYGLPEIFIPGMTMLAGDQAMGAIELSVAIAKRFSEISDKKVILFTLCDEMDISSITAGCERFIVNNTAGTYCEIIVELRRINDIGMVVIINANELYVENRHKQPCYDEESFAGIKKISDEFPVPFLLTYNLSSMFITSRRNHWPVKYDIINWHLIDDYLDNIILVYRRSYYNSRLNYDKSTHIIVEKSKCNEKRSFRIG